MDVTINGLKFKIRNCTDEDYWFVYNLLKNNMYSSFLKHWGGWKPSSFRNSFNKKNIKIVEYKRKRIAYYNLEPKENYSFILNVQISTLMQGKGLGTILMNQIEKETKKHKLSKVRLRVFKDNPAKDFYSKLGYKKIKDEKSAIIMEKKIK